MRKQCKRRVSLDLSRHRRSCFTGSVERYWIAQHPCDRVSISMRPTFLCNHHMSPPSSLITISLSHDVSVPLAKDQLNRFVRLLVPVAYLNTPLFRHYWMYRSRYCRFQRRQLHEGDDKVTLSCWHRHASK